MRVLFLFWHGIGDAIMSLPCFEAYKKQHPDTFVGVATLKNRGKSIVEILQPCVDEILPVLDEPWRWVELYGKELEYGRSIVRDQGAKLAAELEYDEVNEIVMSPLMTSFKTDRVAMEMGVYPLENTQPVISVDDQYIRFGSNFVTPLKSPVLFFHCVAGNRNKTLTPEQASSILSKFEYGSVIECGSAYFQQSTKYAPRSIRETCGILKSVDSIVCIDSTVMHLANAMGLDVNVIFTITPPEQVFGESIPGNVRLVDVNK